MVNGGEPEKSPDSGQKNGRKPNIRKMRTNDRMSDAEIKSAAQERRENSYFERGVLTGMQDSYMKGVTREGGGFLKKGFEKPEMLFFMTGGFMEITVEELKIINEQVQESKTILQSLHNEVRAVHDQVEPELIKQVSQIRNARMNIVSETQTMLTMLRDIRKFFLESDYEKEMGRLKEFITLCKELESLKKRGVLDAVSDTIIKLTIRESEI